MKARPTMRAARCMLLLAGLLAPATALAQSDSDAYTPTQLRRLGHQLFYELIAEHGRAENPEWNQTIRTIGARLQEVSEHPDLEITLAILDGEDFNAGALPGGYIVIYRSLYEWIDEQAREEFPNDRARRDERVQAYLATILSHELSHVLLGHTNKIVQGMRQLVDEQTWDELVDAPPIYEAEQSFNPRALTEQSRSRPKELAADSTGALLMLRAGWQVDDAMRFFRHMDEWERAQERQAGPLPTWLRTHPRASQREATLQAFLADLKMDQARLDDAVSLIRMNAELDVAVELLDDVLEHFPNLLSARHARATALHRQWLNTVPIQVQQVRTTLALKDDRFVTGVRGDLGDIRLLEQARQAYLDVLRVERIPETTSNLAIIEAHLGNTDRAVQLARQAARHAPKNPSILNNLGAVLFLASERAEALSIFERAEALSGRWERTAIVFNIGRTLFAMGDDRGRRTLSQYLELDRRTNWHRYARSLLGSGVEHPERDDRTPSASSEASVTLDVGGVQLGMSDRRVVSILGRPDRVVEGRSGFILHYDSRGLFLVVSENRVSFVGIGRPGAGSVGGIGPGASFSAARSRFGEPMGRRDNLWFFEVADRLVVIGEENSAVRSIGVGFSG